MLFLLKNEHFDQTKYYFNIGSGVSQTASFKHLATVHKEVPGIAYFETVRNQSQLDRF
jgi:hypothetical protein